MVLFTDEIKFEDIEKPMILICPLDQYRKDRLKKNGYVKGSFELIKVIFINFNITEIR